jgi:hypothetical protein
MKRRHEKVSRAADAVAGEHTAGAVRPMCGRRETDEQQLRAWVAEARHGSAPVDLVTVRAALFARDASAVGAEARAEIARDDRGVNRL